MAKNRTPQNALSNKRRALEKDTHIYGVSQRTRGVDLELLTDQPTENGKLGVNTIVGDIRIHSLGKVGIKYHGLLDFVGGYDVMSIEECDLLILGQPEFVDKKQHHLFRYNGYAVWEDLTPEEKASFRDNQRLRVARDTATQAEENSLNGNPDYEGSGPEPDLDSAPPLPNGPSLDLDKASSAAEGREILRTHYARERNPKLVAEAKARHLRRDPTNACQACGTSMRDIYGIDFIEAHHQHPIGESGAGRRTTSDEFDLLCPNCHRALHRLGKGAVLGDLKNLLSRTYRKPRNRIA